MPSFLVLAVVTVFGTSFLYMPVICLVRWWRRRRGLSPARPQVVLDLMAQAQERQVRVERLAWAVDETLADALKTVGPFYDTGPLTEQPTDPYADTFGLHHR